MTISPPSKVKSPPGSSVRVLASGVDSLVLSIDVYWHKKGFLNYLKRRKAEAQLKGKEIQGAIKDKDNEIIWPFTVKPHGSRGYEWILSSKEYTLLVGNWHSPKTKPSILAEIRSETLWLHGMEQAVKHLFHIVKSTGASFRFMKISRVDLCMDLLLPEKIWNQNIMKYKVTRATRASQYYTHKALEGISIGKGSIQARIYDKELEIKQQSKKFWLYNIWGMSKAPRDYKIIRVEFQLRREVIKELGLDTSDDLFEKMGDLWAYCTEKWLKFQTRPGKHHTQRKTLAWWETVQQSFKGDQQSNPLIRTKSIRIDMDQHISQIMGNLVSLQALRREGSKDAREENISIYTMINGFIDEAQRRGMDSWDLDEAVITRRAKFHHHIAQKKIKSGEKGRCRD